ncbi:MAG TPA: hypothetical protein VG733_08625, partial [Chthoniobacteraceae bacterium]|nr:hypothetical protein [Chthoniobacteraceae bacterium]
NFDAQLGRFWHEDDDYCVRALAAGWEVFCMPKLPVIHHGHQSGAAMSAKSGALSRDNQAYLVRKWREMGVVNAQGRIIHPRCAWFPPERYFPREDSCWTQLIEAARPMIQPGAAVFALECFREFFPGTSSYVMLDEQGVPKTDWIIMHKGFAGALGAKVMRAVRRAFHPVFANEVFVLFAKAGVPGKAWPSLEQVHVEALWESANM